MIVQEARERLSEEDFVLFIDVKIERSQGGNNALLYACQSSNDNYGLVNYLVCHANANCDGFNDSTRNALLTATRKSQLNVVLLFLEKKVDINYKDANGCNALHIACT